ncbi:hypothetical protein RF505_07570 [Streptococcus mutans]|jgi:hypothetical protein|uniref:hypothetical protein n=1 Tax=Streptococcus mutans TaxID=1309 RepID=UPI00298EE8D3|nr:hypothetical protein [Streptococcus mutans]MDW8509795.1 hypothetical protein [Streptococcus mutans]
MEKINLNSTKLGDLRFSVNEINSPQVAMITNARVVAKRNNSGEVIDGTIAKLSLSGVDIKLYQLMHQQGLDVSGVIPITIEVVGDESYLKQINVEDIVGKIIDLRSAYVGLKWVARGNSGNWGGLKLILEEVKFVQPKSR